MTPKNKSIFVIFTICFISLSLPSCLLMEEIHPKTNIDEYEPHTVTNNININISYPVEFLKGLLKENASSLPYIESCLNSHFDITNKFHELIKNILNFRDKERTWENFTKIISLATKLGNSIYQKLNICVNNDDKNEMNDIVNSFEEFIFNFPANFKTYFNNYQDNKQKLFSLYNYALANIEDGVMTGITIRKMIDIIVANGNYGDKGLESFEQFELFSNCFSSIVSGPSVNYDTLTEMIKVLQGVGSFENFLGNLVISLEVLSDEVRSCKAFIDNLNKR